MQARLKDWTKPITENDFYILKKISGKIDKLISEYIAEQVKIDKLTANNYEVWGHRTYHNNALFRYMDKEILANSRNKQKSAYHKLVTVMNYWCALWFWEFKDADKIPTREEYWNDIENILDIDFSTKKLVEERFILTSPDSSIEQPTLFDQIVDTEKRPEPQLDTEEIHQEEEDDIPIENEDVVYTKDDAQKILESVSSSGDLFQNARTPIVDELANRYHFFHPQLEFIEVFWLRDGFDIICGNPPWIKLEFDEEGIVSEHFPEISIRGTSAPERKKLLPALFSAQESLHILYTTEYRENCCTTSFLLSPANYPLLIGQQPNLYKCILENGFSLLCDKGYMGLLHPEGIYDDTKGQALRTQVYLRLRYHFQYQNGLNLFAEVAHRERYSSNIYGGIMKEPSFMSINNLFHPSTVDACFAHDGKGTCYGIKINGNWNTSGHRDRIIHYTNRELSVLADTFEDGAPWESVKLVNIHAKEIIDVLYKLSAFKTHIRDYKHIIAQPLHNTFSVVDGTINKVNNTFPKVDDYEMVYSGPHFYVGNPLYKTPRSVCELKGDYDVVDLVKIDKDFIQRTNYVPGISLIKYKGLVSGFTDDIPWIDLFKVGYRNMLSQAGERTLTSAILPPRSSHIHTVLSLTFSSLSRLCEAAGLSESIVFDFQTKTIQASNLSVARLEGFPMGVHDKYLKALYVRTLLLNCLSTNYATIWEELWDDSFRSDSWSISDSRLKGFNSLSKHWDITIPLRNYFERRQSLVEIDVITAMSLGLSLSDLITIYILQFPVLQQNEDDTWYDIKGNIVFTCSKGLIGVGLDRQIWETIRNQKEGETYTHTIDPAKSELYGGQQVTYYAPYTKCDRIEDYRKAWAHFEKVFKSEAE